MAETRNVGEAGPSQPRGEATRAKTAATGAEPTEGGHPHTEGGHPHADPAVAWTGTWQGHRTQQRRAWLAATPAQRLAWLEDAIAVAHQSGALPRRRADASC
jgi:hypothetical protein